MRLFSGRLDQFELRALRDELLPIAEQREPDELVPPGGLPTVYLRRWYLKRSRETGNEYLHQFLRSDDDRALHDHPWDNVSIILSGYYYEHTPAGRRLRGPGDLLMRPADAQHRVELLEGRPVWTFFQTGPKIRDWGFHTADRGWVRWDQYETEECPA